MIYSVEEADAPLEEGTQLRSSLSWLGHEEPYSILRGDSSVRLVFFCRHRDRCVWMVAEALVPSVAL